MAYVTRKEATEPAMRSQHDAAVESRRGQHPHAARLAEADEEQARAVAKIRISFCPQRPGRIQT